MSRIFWDANIFIYLLEGEGERTSAAIRLRKAIRQRGDQLLTSALAIAEVLVKPTETGDEELCARYERTLTAETTVLAFGAAHMRRFAAIRQDRSIRAADAVHLACAAMARTDLFVTGDARLQGKHIEGIQFIVPLERVPL